jgi:hypothetical protein
MTIAHAFNTTEIWILNVGTLKPLELPVEHFLSLAWDIEAWPMNSVDRFLNEWAEREFGVEVKDEVADIMMKYSVSSFATPLDSFPERLLPLTFLLALRSRARP